MMVGVAAERTALVALARPRRTRRDPRSHARLLDAADTNSNLVGSGRTVDVW